MLCLDAKIISVLCQGTTELTGMNFSLIFPGGKITMLDITDTSGNWNTLKVDWEPWKVTDYVKTPFLLHRHDVPKTSVSRDEESHQLLAILFLKTATESYRGHLISWNHLSVYSGLSNGTNYFSGHTHRQNFTQMISYTLLKPTSDTDTHSEAAKWRVGIWFKGKPVAIGDRSAEATASRAPRHRHWARHQEQLNPVSLQPHSLGSGCPCARPCRLSCRS